MVGDERDFIFYWFGRKHVSEISPAFPGHPGDQTQVSCIECEVLTAALPGTDYLLLTADFLKIDTGVNRVAPVVRNGGRRDRVLSFIL